MSNTDKFMLFFNSLGLLCAIVLIISEFTWYRFSLVAVNILAITLNVGATHCEKRKQKKFKEWLENEE